ncbi:hypothetical protein M595_0179 [Lyngbya aestuarii BL J]|uniref:Uncharacterized protein n=1 Tax=Lyngbya aestuarii BL J TaxID=1348334 RepID=U7QRK5_9CYAN|nr:hypothetical protein M595_0179 [Lyngbya aestuarii BL J]
MINKQLHQSKLILINSLKFASIQLNIDFRRIILTPQRGKI